MKVGEEFIQKIFGKNFNSSIYYKALKVNMNKAVLRGWLIHGDDHRFVTDLNHRELIAIFNPSYQHNMSKSTVTPSACV